MTPTDTTENGLEALTVRALTGRTDVLAPVHMATETAVADVAENGAGRRYLNQHSAGSGKSNSIAWRAHQLIVLERDDAPVFDSIVVVTDRRILDKQRALKKLCRYVEGHERAIELKAEIMVDHFHNRVLARNKIGGQARAWRDLRVLSIFAGTNEIMKTIIAKQLGL